MTLPAIMALSMALNTHPTPSNSLQTYIHAKCVATYGEAKAHEKAQFYAPIIAKKAKQYRLSPMLVASLVWHESNFNPREVSGAGALGLCQVMPMWFKHYRVPLSAWKNPATNLDVGLRLYTSYRTRMAHRFPGLSPVALEHRALVSYNMGPGAVHRGIYRSRYSQKVIRDALRHHP